MLENRPKRVRNMYRKNALDGINDIDAPAIKRAKEADLVTLPEDITGTNCYNCKWISQYKRVNYGMCTHPKVRQNVNKRMCCALWARDGMYTPFKRSKEFE